ncbi:cellulose synthase subunit BcsC-related outer membrane protein [Marinospirillum sp.]|uniref:cellulose synthase subunit BcsC-related outer membrane protein n=1 Tax=Marinospirillum sp. TaxID=2183934 RepID=UPI0028709067|nr:cellulose synthase subunit BcsC-related outer membrane protein [Marinospirillum sp.]MDR9468990.1 cellulose synthase subunit BcsC-related outer membrane protein [Marinospirillum sp.]
MRRWITTLLLLGLASSGWAAQPDLLEHQQSTENSQLQLRSDYLLRPAIPESAGSQAATEVDTTGIWFFLRQGEVARARAEWLRLKEANPAWSTPKDMKAAFEQASAPASATLPDKTPEADPYFKAIGQLAAMPEAELPSVKETVLRELAATAESKKRDDHLLLLGWVHFQRQEFQQALKLFDSSYLLTPASSALDGLAITHYKLAQQFLAEDRRKETLFHTNESHKAGRAGVNLELGWAAFSQEKWRLAERLFALDQTLEESVYGRYLALQKLEKLEVARDLACLHKAASSRLAEACLELDTQLAWAAYDAGHYSQASSEFGRLLQDDSQNVSFAKGLLVSLQRLEQPEALVRARHNHPLIEQLLKNQAAEDAKKRKQFDLAARLEDSSYSGEGWMLSSGMKGRYKPGDQGRSHLLRWEPYLAASRMWKELRIGVALKGDWVASGRPPVGSRFGEGEVTANNRSRTLADTWGYSPELSGRWETHRLTLQGRLATAEETPVDSRQWYGDLQAEYYPAKSYFSVQVFRQPLNDSLLSLTGAKDPADGCSWGKVADEGVKVIAALPLHEGVNLVGGATLARQEGKQVESNERYSFLLGLNREAAYRVKDFELDFLRWGPFAEVSGWYKNLSGFGDHDGGYFSPQDYWRLGGQVEFLTLEAQTWQLRGEASVFWSYSQEEHSVGSDTNQGAGAALLAEATYQVSPHALLGGFIQQSAAPDYRDTQLGLVVRIPLEKRVGVTSRDLPLSRVPGH